MRILNSMRLVSYSGSTPTAHLSMLGYLITRNILFFVFLILDPFLCSVFDS